MELEILPKGVMERVGREMVGAELGVRGGELEGEETTYVR
jgi:hypothetical protein